MIKTIRPASPKPGDKGKLIAPVPPGSPPPPAIHPSLGKPSHRWEYRNAQDLLVNLIMRFDRGTEKQFCPVTFRRFENGKCCWVFKGMGENRPLYNLPKLANYPNARVLVVEGEKTADAASKLFDDSWVITTWMGGAKAAGKTDFGPLVGRDVVLWPDNDAPGLLAMKEVANRIGEKRIHQVDLLTVMKHLGTLEDGWDLADFTGEKETIRRLMKKGGVLVKINAEIPNVDPWPEIEDMNAVSSPPSIDLQSMIPDSLDWFRRWITSVSESCGVANDWAFMLGLGAIALCSSGAAELELWPGYRELPPIWMLCLGLPSERKSPIFNRVVEAIASWERNQSAKLKPSLAVYQARRDALLKRCEHLRHKLAQVGKKDSTKAKEDLESVAKELTMWPELFLPLLRVTDSTPEALAELMSRNGGIAGIVDDEGAAIEVFLGRYSDDGGRVEFACKGYSGTSATIVRAGNRVIMMDRPLLSMALAVQPIVLRSILENQNGAHRGFLSRFMISRPPSRIGIERWAPKPVPHELDQQWHEGIARILDQPRRGRIVAAGLAGVFKNLDHPQLVLSDIEPKIIHLSPGAIALAKDFYESFANRQEETKDPYGWSGKIRGNIFRIAHAYRQLIGGSGPLSEETMRAAINCYPYLLGHFKHAMWEAIEPQETSDAKRLIAALTRKGLRQFNRSKSFSLLQTSAFSSADNLDPVLADLCTRGYVRPVVNEKKSGRPPERYEVNPVLFAPAKEDHVKHQESPIIANSSGFTGSAEVVIKAKKFVFPGRRVLIKNK